MSTQRHSVTPHPIETLLTWVKSGEIAIPEIQRPFVWDATKVRNLLDSLYRAYPVGYLIARRNPTVRLKDGTSSAGKRIPIDGQQRVTAMMAALLGREVLTKDYETLRIRIAFHPQEELPPAMGKGAAPILFSQDRNRVRRYVCLIYRAHQNQQYADARQYRVPKNTGDRSCSPRPRLLWPSSLPSVRTRVPQHGNPGPRLMIVARC
jgi:hypothetical protein